MAAIERVFAVLTAAVAAFYLIMNLVELFKRRRKSRGHWLPLLLMLALPAISEAACDTTTVQNQINAASSGQTVTVTPAGCTATWNTNVSIPSTKGITLDFNGATITCGTPCSSNNSPILTVNTNASTATRVTGFNFTSTNGSDGLEIFMVLNGDITHPRFRIDHFSTSADSVGYHLRIDHGWGLIDHCSFTFSGNEEIIHVYGEDTDGWNDDVTPGTLDQVYVEDCTFTNNASPNYLGGKTLATYGARSVWRFNTWNAVTTDFHGNTDPKNRWGEVYYNTYNAVVNSTNINVSDWIVVRGGSGVYFNNTISNASSGGSDNFTSYNDEDPSCGTYLDSYQPGTGKNQAATPMYFFGNSSTFGFSLNAECPNMVQQDRDVYTDRGGSTGVQSGTSLPGTCTTGQGYWKTDEGGDWNTLGGGANDGRLYKCTATNTWTAYMTPAVYPHELQGSGGGGSVGTLALFLEWGAMVLGLMWHGRAALLMGCLTLGAAWNSFSVIVGTTVRQVAYQSSVLTVQTVNKALERFKG